MKSSKLTTKDIFTVVLLALVNILVFGLGTFFYLSPITILMMPVFYALTQGIVFFMLGGKIRKKGAIFLYCVIMGVIGFNIPYILMHIVAGLIAELVLAKIGYASIKGLTVSYVVLQLLACVGSTIYPYAIILDATLKGTEGNGNLGFNIEAAGHMIQSWGVLVLIAAVFVCALLGAWIGQKLMKKYLRTDEE